MQLVENSVHNDYRKSIIAKDCADAIIVPSGMLKIHEVGDSTYIEWGDPDRFFEGIALFKAVKAQKLELTGGKMRWEKAKKTEGEVLNVHAISNGISSEKLFETKIIYHILV